MKALSSDAEELHKDMMRLAARMLRRYPEKARQLRGAATILSGWVVEMKKAEKEPDDDRQTA